MSDEPCEHFTEGEGVCGGAPTRGYLTGRKCAWHTPAFLAGREETVPDPALTLEGLRARDADDLAESA